MAGDRESPTNNLGGRRPPALRPARTTGGEFAGGGFWGRRDCGGAGGGADGVEHATTQRRATDGPERSGRPPPAPEPGESGRPGGNDEAFHVVARCLRGGRRQGGFSRRRAR